MDNIIVTYKNMKDESKVRLKIREGYNYEVVPVPRQISVSCGIAHKIPYDSFVDIAKMIMGMFNTGELFDSDVHFYKDLGNNNYERFSIIY